VLDAAKEKIDEMKGKKGFDGFGKRKGFNHLTDEEITAVASMSDDEKKAFFDAKKIKMKAEMEAHKAVIDKLILGETLTADEEAIRLEILTHFEDENNYHSMRRDGGDIIAKLVAGDELTQEDQTELADMQAKHVEREAVRALVEPIIEKVKAGEALTDEEKAILEANKPAMSQHGKMSHKGGTI
jgi:hypothetical protein